jgi:hypothetical protein
LNPCEFQEPPQPEDIATADAVQRLLALILERAKAGAGQNRAPVRKPP